MAKQKSRAKKPVQEKTIMNKIGGKVGHLAGELAVGKDHLMAMAGNAIESVKSTIQNITVSKKAAVKKKVKSAVNGVTKKAQPARKKAQPATKKATKTAAANKNVPSKKVAKKVAKKAVTRK